MTDAERHQKRLDVLAQVNIILKLCHCSNTHLKQTCEHCIKLLPLGEQLLILTKPRKIIKSDGSITPGVVKERRLRLKPKDFTIEEYLSARIKGFTDTQFASTVLMSSRSFCKWKSNNLKEINQLKKKMKVK